MIPESLRLLFVAAEDAGLPGAQIGGVADVVAGASHALAVAGHRVHVCVPSYGRLHGGPGAVPLGEVSFPFGGSECIARAWKVEGTRTHPNLTRVVMDGPAFSGPEAENVGSIYVHDPPERPFATDANRFAQFSAAVARAVEAGIFGELDAVHLHEWQTGCLLALRDLDPSLTRCRGVRCVFSIHNLCYQGIRPFAGDPSSWERWFPHLDRPGAGLVDPRWPHCFNAMAAAIRLADVVHVVSPTYAEEVLRPNEPERNFHGGEGLESLLTDARRQGRLVGILNACDETDRVDIGRGRRGFRESLAACRSAVERFIAAESTVPSDLFLAHARLGELAARQARPPVVLTSAGRLSDQKIFLMREEVRPGVSALEAILEGAARSGACLILGTGEERYVRFLAGLAGRCGNLVFMRGFSVAAAEALYRLGDLFLMPSSFEPCGISQMQAMRHGQPCCVHGVGGLRLTVEHRKTGFVFRGRTPREQAASFVESCEEAIHLRRSDPREWARLRRRAAARRFHWHDVATCYVRELYRPGAS